jgi:hypothetical protein
MSGPMRTAIILTDLLTEPDASVVALSNDIGQSIVNSDLDTDVWVVR